MGSEIKARHGIRDEKNTRKINAFTKAESLNSQQNLSDNTTHGDESSELSNSETSTNGLTSSPKPNREKTPTEYKHLSHSARRETPESAVSKSTYKVKSASLVVLVVFLAFAYKYSFASPDKNPSYSAKKCTFSDLQDKYPEEDTRLWNHLATTIESIMNNSSQKNPAVHLFLHLNTSISNVVISDIVDKSSSCLDSSLQPVKLEDSEFTSEKSINDYGYIIEKYKNTVKKGNVVLLPVLNKIPPKTARALHSICDTISFIHPKVVIFLSLAIEQAEVRAIDTARSVLRQMWEKELADYELEPLITRVTEDVTFLQSTGNSH